MTPTEPQDLPYWTRRCRRELTNGDQLSIETYIALQDLGEDINKIVDEIEKELN